jgi:DNA processing protein
MITVDFAAEYSWEVFCVPGNVSSEHCAGCHRVLRDGARWLLQCGGLLTMLALKGAVRGAGGRRYVRSS